MGVAWWWDSYGALICLAEDGDGVAYDEFDTVETTKVAAL